jgi:hypothetical protein
MQRKDLPERWKDRVRKHLADTGSKYDWLGAGDLNVSYQVMLRFDDGSFAFFRYAFYLIDKDNNEVAVFTEHCGYHIFNLSGTEIELSECKYDAELDSAD